MDTSDILYIVMLFRNHRDGFLFHHMSQKNRPCAPVDGTERAVVLHAVAQQWGDGAVAIVCHHIIYSAKIHIYFLIEKYFYLKVDYLDPIFSSYSFLGIKNPWYREYTLSIHANSKNKWLEHHR